MCIACLSWYRAALLKTVLKLSGTITLHTLNKGRIGNVAEEVITSSKGKTAVCDTAVFDTTPCQD